MSLSIAGRRLTVHYGWIVVAATFVALLTCSGIRQSFGVFLVPLQDEFQTNRASVALIASLSILVNGLIQPIMGQLLDRHGPRIIATLSLCTVAVGMVASSFVSELWQLYITFGVIVPVAAGGPATVMAAVVSVRWFTKHRGLVLGILSAGHSTGQLMLIPLAMQLNITYGWRTSYQVLALVVAVMVLPTFLFLRNNPGDMGLKPFGADGSARAARTLASDSLPRFPVSFAIRTRGFWMIALSFAICGYTSAGLISTHLVAFTVARGFDEVVAASALGIMGAVNIVGTIASGIITDRIGRKKPLAAYYIVRAMALFFLLTVYDPLGLDIFAVIFGLGYIATGPPTTGLVAMLFGRQSVGSIYGLVFMSHQIGGALGSYITALIYDATGQYYPAILLSAGLLFIAAALALSIKEEPVIRPRPGMTLT